MNLCNFDQESSDSHQEDVEMLTMSATTSTNSPSIVLSDMQSRVSSHTLLLYSTGSGIYEHSL